MQYLNWKLAVVVLASIMASACATTERPIAELSKAEAVIEEAERINSEEFGAVALERARNKLKAAKRAADDERHVEAARLANEAELDARLAEAQTDRGKSEVALREITENLDALRRESTHEIVN